MINGTQNITIINLSPDTVDYRDIEKRKGIMYYYRICAFNKKGEGCSNKVRVKVPDGDILYLYPENETIDVPGGTEIFSGISVPGEKTVIELMDEEGNSVPGDLTETQLVSRGDIVSGVAFFLFRYDPFGAEPPFYSYNRLKPLTKYIAKLRYDDLVLTHTFTTSSYGLPLEINDSDLVGRTYILDLNKAWVEEPYYFENIFNIINYDGTLSFSPLLLYVMDVNSTDKSINLVNGYACTGREESGDCLGKKYGEQNMEINVKAWRDADFNPPFFVTDPAVANIVLNGFIMRILNMRIGGVFSKDGERIGEGMVEGYIDLLNIAPTNFGYTLYADIFCERYYELTGLDCIQCPAPYDYRKNCLKIKIVNANGTLTSSSVPFKIIVAPEIIADSEEQLTGNPVNIKVTFNTPDGTPISSAPFRVSLNSSDASFQNAGSCNKINYYTIDCITDNNGMINGISITDNISQSIIITASYTGASLPPGVDGVTEGHLMVSFK